MKKTANHHFFAGKLVLATGGASGLGRQLLGDLYRLGANVVAWDLDQTGLDGLGAELFALNASGQRFRLDKCDITDRTAVYELARTVQSDMGVPDIIINCAGVVSGKTLLETADERIRLSLEVNALSLFWLAKAFLPGMIARDSGSFVTISSAAGIIGVTGLADYSASKFAAFGFDEAMRTELHKTGSRVQTLIVCPFFINTGMFAGVKTRVPWLLPILEPDYVVGRILAAIRRGKRRLIMPAIVGSVWFLRLLPVGWFDWWVRLLGVNASMDGFTGRQPSR